MTRGAWGVKMKTVILAGGHGTRISEESHLRPKPMIEIGGRPILWHIMKLFASHGYAEFIICLGYRGYMIKEYFTNYVLHNSDLTVDLSTGDVAYHALHQEPWRVTLIDTGADTMTGGRLKRVASHLQDGGPFFLTYGDGLSDVDLTALAAFHRTHGKAATVTAVAPPGRYGALEIADGIVQRFTEKPPGDNALINGGFLVLNPSVVGQDRRRPHGIRERAPRGTRTRPSARCIPARRVLGGYGHTSRQESLGGAVDGGDGALASLNREFWRGKRILLTGHTGFKGGWAAIWLTRLGAQ